MSVAQTTQEKNDIHDEMRAENKKKNVVQTQFFIDSYTYRQSMKKITFKDMVHTQSSQSYKFSVYAQKPYDC